MSAVRGGKEECSNTWTHHSSFTSFNLHSKSASPIKGASWIKPSLYASSSTLAMYDFRLINFWPLDRDEILLSLSENKFRNKIYFRMFYNTSGSSEHELCFISKLFIKQFSLDSRNGPGVNSSNDPDSDPVSRWCWEGDLSRGRQSMLDSLPSFVEPAQSRMTFNKL